MIEIEIEVATEETVIEEIETTDEAAIEVIADSHDFVSLNFANKVSILRLTHI